MREQILYQGPEAPETSLDAYLKRMGITHIFLVCGRSIRFLHLNDYFSCLEERLGIKVTWFQDFTPNPQYESAVKGTALYREKGCDGIIAVGGGSAMDVAKCVRLFAALDPSASYLEQPYEENGIPFLAVPTTAGTGSEATHFAVVYDGERKLSVAHESSVPQAVVFDPSVLVSLPDYQRRATMMDALCHAVESCWSVKADEKSRAIAKEAIRQVLGAKDGYLANTPEGNRDMLIAANTAGRAINLTQTTAGHAMCYRLTGLFGIAHGHAAALCVSVLWPFMIRYVRRQEALSAKLPAAETGSSSPEAAGSSSAIAFAELADAWGVQTPEEAADSFIRLVKELGLDKLKRPDKAGTGSMGAEAGGCAGENATGSSETLRGTDSRDSASGGAPEEVINTLADSVNLQRLKNNPVALNREEIVSLYEEIFRRYGA